jgi:16S rRNA (guanine1207-N2)-methyltransferase
LAETAAAGVYGEWSGEIAPAPAGAVQLAPTVPGSAALEELPQGALTDIAILAPAGTAERRYTLALSLQALRPGGGLLALAPKPRGGARLRAELEAFGCTVTEEARRHHRVCRVEARPALLKALDEAIEGGAPRLVPAIGLWSQPGVFSWDRVDPGSALLARHVPASTGRPSLAGRGADLGCGIGVLARAVLSSRDVIALTLVDHDRRAIGCARRNVDDPRVAFQWADVRGLDLAGLDFVVMNPPFHAGGTEDQGLGREFIRAAARMLRKGGLCRLVANRHLAYEAVLRETFKQVTPLEEAGGFKVYEARR